MVNLRIGSNVVHCQIFNCGLPWNVSSIRKQLCHVMSCHVVRSCHVVSCWCCVMCCVVLCCVVLCHVVSCCAVFVLCHVMSYHYHVIPCKKYFTQWHQHSCRATQNPEVLTSFHCEITPLHIHIDSQPRYILPLSLFMMKCKQVHHCRQC